jgi:hypothetical protein
MEVYRMVAPGCLFSVILVLAGSGKLPQANQLGAADTVQIGWFISDTRSLFIPIRDPAVQGRVLLNPTLVHRDYRGRINRIARCKEAEITVRRNGGVVIILVHARECEVTTEDGSLAFFDDRTFED